MESDNVSQSDASEDDFYNTTGIGNDIAMAREPSDRPTRYDLVSRHRSVSSSESANSTSGSEQSQDVLTQHQYQAGTGYALSTAQGVASKRRLSSVSHGPAAKKARLQALPSFPSLDPSTLPSTAGIPAEVWQHVFSFLPPDILCLCARVNTSFSSYLATQSKTLHHDAALKAATQFARNEVIWRESRQTFLPGLPAPLVGLTEQQMLSLVAGRDCQSCGRQFQLSTVRPSTIWNAGPGAEGMRVIWPFHTRMCGACFSSQTIKDTDLLKTVDAVLRPGLPFAFRSADNNYILGSNLTALPAKVQISKLHSMRQVDAFRNEYLTAQDESPTLGADFLRGLAERRNQDLASVNPWLDWEWSLPQGSYFEDALRSRARAAVMPNAPGYAVDSTKPAMQPYFGHQVLPSHPSSTTIPVWDAQRIMQQRKDAIVELCSTEFNPPIDASTLQHMPAFQAAAAVAIPLNQDAWNLLKPQIESQRYAAEEMEYNRLMRQSLLDASSHGHDGTQYAAEHYGPQARKHDAEQRQKYHASVIGYTVNMALEKKRAEWRNGKALNKQNVPNFVAEVIIETCRKYATTSDPDIQPRLVLETVRWAYENRIRPSVQHIDGNKPELFRCTFIDEDASCGARTFTFEGMMQHASSKHGDVFDFRNGNIIVDWQNTDWPDPAPFHPVPCPNLFSAYRANSSTPDLGHESESVSRVTRQRSEGELSEEAYSPTLPAGPIAKTDAKSTPWGTTSGTSFVDQNENIRSFDVQAPEDLRATGNFISLMWDQLTYLPGIEKSISVQAMIFHANTVFKHANHKNLDLDRFMEIVLFDRKVQSLKNCEGLACGTCVLDQMDSSGNLPPYDERIAAAGTQSFAELLTHYQTLHHPSDEKSNPAWLNELVERPNPEDIRNQVMKSTMTPEQRIIIVEALAYAFPGGYKVAEQQAEIAALRARDRGRPMSKKKKAKEMQRMQRKQHQSVMPTSATLDDQGTQDEEYDPANPALGIVRAHHNQGSSAARHQSRFEHPSASGADTSEDLERLPPNEEKLAHLLLTLGGNGTVPDLSHARPVKGGHAQFSWSDALRDPGNAGGFAGRGHVHTSQSEEEDQDTTFSFPRHSEQYREGHRGGRNRGTQVSKRATHRPRRQRSDEIMEEDLPDVIRSGQRKPSPSMQSASVVPTQYMQTHDQYYGYQQPMQAGYYPPGNIGYAQQASATYLQPISSVYSQPVSYPYHHPVSAVPAPMPPAMQGQPPITRFMTADGREVDVVGLLAPVHEAAPNQYSQPPYPEERRY